MIDYGPLLLHHRGTAGSKLKIGLALSTRRGPVWLRNLIELLESIRQFDIRVFVVSDDDPPPEVRPSSLTDRLYTMSKEKYDPFRIENLRPDHQPMTTTARLAMVAAGLDMVVWLPSGPLPSGGCSGLAKYGVFTIQLGDNHWRPPYWTEVMRRDVVSMTSVFWHTASFERGRVVKIAETSTQQGWFFTRNAEEPLIAAARMLAEVGLELLSDAFVWREDAMRLPEIEKPAEPTQFPGFYDALRFAAYQTNRTLTLRAKAKMRKSGWFVAIRRRPNLFYSRTGRFSTTDIEDLPTPPGTQLADPFVMSDNDRSWLFVELIPPGLRKGTLAVIRIEGGRVSMPEPILEKEYHLSYPCVFRHKGETFMIPETCGARNVQLYKAALFPHRFEPQACLIDNLSVVDTTPLFHDGKWYFFTTTTEPFLETMLFWSDSLDGGWRLHPKSPISTSVRNTRAAGHLFRHEGRLLRPTQDCSVRYGYGIVINEIKRLTPTAFEEQRVDYIGPTWRRGLVATHTLNSSDALEVIDGIRYEK